MSGEHNFSGLSGDHEEDYSHQIKNLEVLEQPYKGNFPNEQVAPIGEPIPIRPFQFVLG